jgi:predicted Zn finger-like uncharacterized protein
MRIACPSCAATYEVPESRLKPGKMVRCARCGGEWLPARDGGQAGGARGPAGHSEERAAEPEAERGAEPAVIQPMMTAMHRLAGYAPSPSRSRGLIGAWVLTVVILAAAVSTIIIWRQEFISIWPPSGRILAPADHVPSKPERIPGTTAG